MDAHAAISSGRPSEALKPLLEEVRNNPADPLRRTALFQLCSALGQWERARNQLDALESLDAEAMMSAQLFRKLIEGEATREQVFAGKRAPTLFGEPPAWAGLLVQALRFVASGDLSAAASLRDRAFDAAPTTPGKINGDAFEWIADADSRLGPVLEVYLDGDYYWAPFTRVASMEIAPPQRLSDVVWLPATFTWITGGQSAGFIPARYPGTASSGDDALLMGRRTDWRDESHGFSFGAGQRILATDGGHYPLLDVRAVELNQLP